MPAAYQRVVKTPAPTSGRKELSKDELDSGRGSKLIRLKRNRTKAYQTLKDDGHGGRLGPPHIGLGRVAQHGLHSRSSGTGLSRPAYFCQVMNSVGGWKVSVDFGDRQKQDNPHKHCED